jgi:hypothetical protein
MKLVEEREAKAAENSNDHYRQPGRLSPYATSDRIVGELDKGESGPFPGGYL